MDDTYQEIKILAEIRRKLIKPIVTFLSSCFLLLNQFFLDFYFYFIFTCMSYLIGFGKAKGNKHDSGNYKGKRRDFQAKESMFGQLSIGEK